MLDPRALVEQAADAWAKVWTAADQPPEQSQPQHWKPRAPRGPPLPLITGEQVNDVAKRLVAGTAGSGDRWRARELRALPAVFWDRLADLLNLCEAQGR